MSQRKENVISWFIFNIIKLTFNISAMCKEQFTKYPEQTSLKKFLFCNSKTRSLGEKCCSCDNVVLPAEILEMRKKTF